MDKIALLAGATGLVGNLLLNELLQHKLYQKVIVVSRRPININHPKLEVKIVDFDQLDTISFTDKIDECFCALGTTQKKSGKEGLKKVDYEYVLKLASLCKKENIVKMLVVSSNGANPKSMFFYMRTKGLMEQDVKAAGIPISYVLRPSLITGKRNEVRLAETIGSYLYKILEPIMVGKLRKMRAVSAIKISRCMINMAQNQQKGHFVIESDEIQNH